MRDTAGQYGLAKSSVERHKAKHLQATISRASIKVERATQRAVVKHEAAKVGQELDLLALIGRSLDTVRKMQDACEEFLRDPADPSRYSLQPRAHELTVIYLERAGEANGTGVERMQQRSAPLAELISRLQGELGVEVLRTRWTVTDPRKLVLEASAALRGHVEFLAGLMLRSRQELDREIGAFVDELRAGLSPGALAEVLAVLADRRSAAGEAAGSVAGDR